MEKLFKFAETDKSELSGFTLEYNFSEKLFSLIYKRKIMRFRETGVIKYTCIYVLNKSIRIYYISLLISDGSTFSNYAMN